eukprot:133372-Pyramimonas_sp.AAC.1
MSCVTSVTAQNTRGVQVRAPHGHYTLIKPLRHCRMQYSPPKYLGTPKKCAPLNEKLTAGYCQDSCNLKARDPRVKGLIRHGVQGVH